MKYLIALLTFLAGSAMAQDACTVSGQYVEVPEGMEIRFVPVGTPETLIAVKGIKVEVPEVEGEGAGCGEEGELSVGGSC